MRRIWWLSLALAGCPEGSGGRDNDATDPDHSDTDPSHTDVVEDTAEPTITCDEGAYPTADDTPGTCAVAEVTCGDVVQGTTVGGTHDYDRTTWATAQCLDWLLGDPGDLDGPERVYGFTVPPDQFGRVILRSPCANLEVRAVGGSESCTRPPANCTAGTGDFRHARLTQLPGTAEGRRWEIIVDGYEGDAGNYELLFECVR